jgi:hypothetical protein
MLRVKRLWPGSAKLSTWRWTRQDGGRRPPGASPGQPHEAIVGRIGGMARNLYRAGKTASAWAGTSTGTTRYTAAIASKGRRVVCASLCLPRFRAAVPASRPQRMGGDASNGSHCCRGDGVAPQRLEAVLARRAGHGHGRPLPGYSRVRAPANLTKRRPASLSTPKQRLPESCWSNTANTRPYSRSQAKSQGARRPKRTSSSTISIRSDGLSNTRS